MNDYLMQIAYNEGAEAYLLKILSVGDNPYDGVSDTLASAWFSGFWNMMVEDEE